MTHPTRTYEELAALENYMEECLDEAHGFYEDNWQEAVEEGHEDELMSEEAVKTHFQEMFNAKFTELSGQDNLLFQDDEFEIAENFAKDLATQVAEAHAAGNEFDRYEDFADSEEFYQERLAYRYAEAEDTPAEKLAELAEHRNESIRKGVANHSNTISGTLDELVEEFPYQVAHNEEASAEAMAYAAEQALNSPNRFPDNEAQETLEAVAWGNNTNSETLAMIAGDESDENTLVRVRVAGHPNASVETLEQLAHDEDGNVRFYVARNANTPSETLDVLSNDEKSYKVRMAVARNENTSVETLDKLSNDENSRVRHWVAQNENTSIETLVKLSKDEQFRIRSEIASNENTPYETKIEMAEIEESPTVLMSLADEDFRTHPTLVENENTPSNVLELIYENDYDNDFDYDLATHNNTPKEVSTDILRNTDEALIFETLDRFNYSWEERVALIENNNLDIYKRLEMTMEEEDPRAILALANSEVEGVRMNSAKNPLMPQEILAEMAQENIDTRDSVARNQGASVEILTELTKDENEGVREAAAENLATRSEEKTTETKNKYAAKYQKTSEALDERGASAGLGE